MIRRSNLILMAVASIAFLSLGQPSRAGIVSQTGTGDCGAQDLVDVEVSSVLCDEFIIGKTFFDVVEHEMNIVQTDDPFFTENIFNFTDEFWKDFHLSFWSTEQFSVSLEVDGIGANVEEMSGFSDDMFHIEFWIFFDEPLLFQQGFILSGEIDPTVDEQQITLIQRPSIPEPGSLALFATGLAALAFIGWRRRKAV